jgi:hypothetical protein
MSNEELDALVFAILALHLGVLAAAIWRRAARPALLWLTGGDALFALAWQIPHPQAFLPPFDWQVIAFSAFEITVLAVVVMALRGVRYATAAARTAFAIHLTFSILAVVFALTFKITRLI